MAWKAAVDRSFAEVLAAHYRRMHDRVLVLIDDLSDEELAWRPSPSRRSIAWNFAHLTQASRRLGANLPSMAPRLDGLLGSGQPAQAATDPDSCDHPGAGLRETGDDADRPAGSGKEVLLKDARQAFATVERLIAAIGGPRRPARPQVGGDAEPCMSGEIGEALVGHLVHAHRHLGEIECLRGLQGVGGAPTG